MQLFHRQILQNFTRLLPQSEPNKTLTAIDLRITSFGCAGLPRRCEGNRRIAFPGFWHRHL
jgi:hypothetical protein